jgi:hypothetical protein
MAKLRRGALTKYGYAAAKPAAERRAALGRAAAAYGVGGLARKLNAVAVLNKNRNPDVARTFRNDLRFVQRMRKQSGGAGFKSYAEMLEEVQARQRSMPRVDDAYAGDALQRESAANRQQQDNTASSRRAALGFAAATPLQPRAIGDYYLPPKPTWSGWFGSWFAPRRSDAQKKHNSRNLAAWNAPPPPQRPRTWRGWFGS